LIRSCTDTNDIKLQLYFDIQFSHIRIDLDLMQSELPTKKSELPSFQDLSCTCGTKQKQICCFWSIWLTM